MGADETPAYDLADHHRSLRDRKSQVVPLLIRGPPGFCDPTHRARDQLAGVKMRGEASLAPRWAENRAFNASKRSHPHGVRSPGPSVRCPTLGAGGGE